MLAYFARIRFVRQLFINSTRKPFNYMARRLTRAPVRTARFIINSSVRHLRSERIHDYK